MADSINLLDIANPKKLKDTLNQVLEDTAASNAAVEELAAQANTTAEAAKEIANSAKQRADVALETAQEAVAISENALNTATETAEDFNQLELKVNGLNLEMSYDASTGVLGITLKDSEGNILSESSKDLPLELLISSGTYNSETKEIVLTLANGDVLNIDVTGLIDTYLADEETLTLDGNTFKIKDEFIEQLKQNGGIKTLVGTEDKPINLATDLEVGKLYLLYGHIRRGSFIWNTTITRLSHKPALNEVLFFNTNFSHPSILACGFTTRCYINTDTGYITNTIVSVGLQTNGSVPGTATPINIFAPTSGGTKGQILQSNGNTEPTWADPSELRLATLDDVTNAINGAWEDSY